MINTSVSGNDTASTSLSFLDEAANLQPEMTFETFVSGRSNQLALMAANQFIQVTGEPCNPLFVVGEVGVGKTHLLHAIGNAILADRPDTKIRYVHSEDFFSDVIRAYRAKSFEAFKHDYQSLDLLMLDDIQYLKNKQRTQEELYYAVNALCRRKKQVVISGDSRPSDLLGFDERLTSRFETGLTVNIKPATLEMRTTILKRLANRSGTNLSSAVVDFVAKSLPLDIRKLVGAINRLALEERLHRRKVTLSWARSVMAELL